MLDFLQSDTEGGPRFSPEELEALILAEEARESLYAYTKLTWPPDYHFNWHHTLLVDYLERVERGEIDRLMVLMPPRYGKSELASIRFPCWYLGRNPTKKVIIASHSNSLAEDFGRDTRNLIEHPIHELAFPNCTLRHDSRSAQRWQLEAGGRFVAAGVGSSKIMGRGAHLIILDDLIGSWEDAQSEAERKKVWDWYKGTLYHRRQKDAAIVIVNTRWNSDDLPGKLLEEEPDRWTVIRIPAIAERDMIYDNRLYRAGETLWPDMYDKAFVLETKRIVSDIVFEPVYQQNPQAEDGNILKRSYWKRDYSVPDAEIVRVIQSWDTAYKKGEENSYSACSTWVETASCFWLVHVWWGRVSFPELKRKAVELYLNEKNGIQNYFHPFGRPNQVLVEDKASGQSLVPELEEDTTLPVEPIKPEGDKVARAHVVSPVFATGNVGILDGREWEVEDGEEKVTSKDVIDICAKFPGVKNKDIVDSITQAVQHLRHGNTFKYTYHYASNGKRKSIFDREREARENGGNGKHG